MTFSSMKTEKQQRAAAAEFAKRWAGRGSEKSESEKFWLDLLGSVYGVEKPIEFVDFQDKVKLDNTSFIDIMIPSTHVMIEQKSIDKDLRKPIRQSDGTMLTPFQQAQRYSAAIKYSDRPRWIVTCNFAEFDVYDMENPDSEPQRILLKNLGKEYYRLQFLVDEESEHIIKEMEVSMQAGELVARIYDALLEQYDKNDPNSLRYLNILCVRLVFCLYAEDAGIFGKHDMFYDYLKQFDERSMRAELLRLFAILNTPPQERDPYTRKDLLAFPYTNGGLFAEKINIPPFTIHIRYALLQRASKEFDWSQISPTIFGGVFESTLNPETRRHGGMHYTSIENIHKVIDPLFLNSLKREFNEIMDTPVLKTRLSRLHAFQDKLASLRFFDPACGSGNFLTESYLSLRRLENKVIKEIYSKESYVTPIKVSINQFYGIEINDFAVTVAATALWISESQMMAETESIVNLNIEFLPLKSNANIREGNALRIDWHEVCPNPDYIFGNPPFVGARMMSPEQKDDMLHVFGKDWKNLGNIDYVGAWYKLAADMMRGTSIRAALVSTNSVTQGEQVANLWAPLMQEGVKINFAHRTFRWDSEANLKAHVHCVIVGFSCASMDRAGFDARPQIFDNGQVITARHINPYLIDAPDVFVYSRPQALCDVPPIGIGNQPIDGGNYLFSKEEKEAFVKKEPKAEPYFHLWFGAEEFIRQKPRYCLWLGDCSPHELNQMPLCKQRVENVRQLRLASKRASTLRLADKPTRFQVENMPEGDSIIIPSTSSEKRRYIPMGYIPSGVFASNAVHLIPSATLYHFGVLESNVHMAWMRVVCGRLKSDYRYSKDIVYNNFPWPVGAGLIPARADAAQSRAGMKPAPTELVQRIEQTAQSILDARAKYPDSSLADLYDPVLMPSDLQEAHRANDRAVMAAYGFSPKMTESECVARLFEMYAQLEKESK